MKRKFEDIFKPNKRPALLKTNLPLPASLKPRASKITRTPRGGLCYHRGLHQESGASLFSPRENRGNKTCPAAISRTTSSSKVGLVAKLGSVLSLALWANASDTRTEETGKQVEQLVDRLQLAEFEPGEVILKQGTPNNNLYILHSGSVVVTKSGR